MDTVTTGKNGSVHVDLDAGDYYAVEIEAAKGFEIDETPQYFTVVDGKTTTLTVTNKALSGILIHKINSVTGKGIQGVTFLLYDSTNTPIGQYTSDDSGYVYIENLTTTGRFYLRELENEGYVPDNQMKTVYVNGETTLVEWKNIPITAQDVLCKGWIHPIHTTAAHLRQIETIVVGKEEISYISTTAVNLRKDRLFCNGKTLRAR